MKAWSPIEIAGAMPLDADREATTARVGEMLHSAVTRGALLDEQ